MSGTKTRRGKRRAAAASRVRDRDGGALRIVIDMPLVVSDANHLRLTYDTVRELRAAFAGARGQVVILDMERCPKIDAGGTLLLKAELDRGMAAYDVTLDLRWPRARAARLGVTVAGFRGEGEHPIAKQVLEEGAPPAVLSDRTLAVSSGAKGEETGALTFRAAKFAEQLGDPILADRIHAALNEAADNVLSWAYRDPPPDLPAKAQRWWAIGVLSRSSQSAFIALDLGATIPATAPRFLGDRFQLYLAEAIAKGGFALIPAARAEADTLLATINYRRSVSGKGERGKGLTSMIGLIDLLKAGEIAIISGDAIYGYQRKPGRPEPIEFCRPLGWRFEGTMIMWNVGGASKLNR